MQTIPVYWCAVKRMLGANVCYNYNPIAIGLAVGYMPKMGNLHKVALIGYFFSLNTSFLSISCIKKYKSLNFIAMKKANEAFNWAVLVSLITFIVVLVMNVL